MTHEDQSPESRKLDALLAIGSAVTTLSTNLTMMFRENLDQTALLKRVESKLDQVLEILNAKDREDVG